MLVGYKVLFGVGVKIGYFDVKMCELIVFVVVVMICCDGCIVVYMVEVVKYGVIKEEVVEVFGVVIVLNVGVVFVYLVWVMDVFGDWVGGCGMISGLYCIVLYGVVWCLVVWLGGCVLCVWVCYVWWLWVICLDVFVLWSWLLCVNDILWRSVLCVVGLFIWVIWFIWKLCCFVWSICWLIRVCI